MSESLFDQSPATLRDRLQAAQRKLQPACHARVYTDGSCSGNPGPGGWGALFSYSTAEQTGLECCVWGGEAETTNNRMELLAALRALQLLPTECRVEIHTDSQYLQKGMTSWLAQWRKRNWRSSSGKKVRNLDLWQQLERLVNGRSVRWQWVRGHAGIVGNERADQLARDGLAEI